MCPTRLDSSLLAIIGSVSKVQYLHSPVRNTLIFRTTLTGPNYLKLTHDVYYIFTYITTFGSFKQNTRIWRQTISHLVQYKVFTDYQPRDRTQFSTAHLVYTVHKRRYCSMVNSDPWYSHTHLRHKSWFTLPWGAHIHERVVNGELCLWLCWLNIMERYTDYT
jgi:hypothetical protein